LYLPGAMCLPWRHCQPWMGCRISSTRDSKSATFCSIRSKSVIDLRLGSFILPGLSSQTVSARVTDSPVARNPSFPEGLQNDTRRSV